MKLKQTALALAIGVMAVSAQADFWIQTSNGNDNHDGVVGPLTGMDLYGPGSAAFFCATSGGCAGGAVGYGAQIGPGAVGQIAIGDYVTVYYQGIVSTVYGGTTPNLYYHGSTPPDPYQITLAAKFTEKVIGGFSFPGGASNLLLPVSGQFGLYYDDNSATFANIAAGTGFTDGIPLLEGVVNGGSANYTVFPIGSATGSANIAGRVLSAALGQDNPSPSPPYPNDVVGFMPNAPVGINVGSNIQYGLWVPNTDHQTVNFFDNANGWTPQAVDPHLTARADADIRFIPEPTTLALLGLGLAGLGLSLRRRAA